MTRGASESHQGVDLGQEVCAEDQAHAAAEAGQGSAVVKQHGHFHGVPRGVELLLEAV